MQVVWAKQHTQSADKEQPDREGVRCSSAGVRQLLPPEMEHAIVVPCFHGVPLWMIAEAVAATDSMR